METNRPRRSNRLLERSFVLYLTVLLLALVFISYLGYVYHLNFRETMVRQWKQQLGATLDVSALRIENFSAKFAANLVTVSHNPVIKQRICDTQLQMSMETNYCPLHDLYELHKTEIDAILLIDTLGNIIRRFPNDSVGSILGKQCLSRVNIERTLAEDEAYVSESFRNKMGFMAITISCPVYNDSALAGILRWMVSYRKIGKNYFDVIRLGNQTKLWMADADGRVQYHPDSTLLNRKAEEVIGNSSFKEFAPNGKLIDMGLPLADFLNSRETGSFTYVGKDAATTLCLFRDVKMLNRSWRLYLSLPMSNISGPIRRHAITTLWMEVLVLLLFGLFGYIFFLTQKRKTHLETEARYLIELANSAEQLHVERQNRLRATIDGQEKERNRIARELHDSLGQYLLAMKVKLQGLLHDAPSIDAAKVEAVSQLSGVAIDEVKRISENLMPRTLDEFGLTIATQRLCAETSRDAGIQIDFVSFGLPAAAELKYKTHLYRIVQEALSNAVKHSKASHVDIQLLGNPEQFTLLIQDDGVGFEAGLLELSHGNGLKNIMDRVRIMEGEIELNTAPGSGTSMRIKVQEHSWQGNENSEGIAGR